MESSLLGPTTRIIWHDPVVNNEENVTYFTEKFSHTEIERFSNYEKVIDFLYEAPGFWIIITSGSKGCKLLELIHDSRKVLGIVIFCSNKELHEKWAQDFPKVKKVTIDIKEVVSEVELLFKRFLLQGVLQVAGEERKQNESNTISNVLNKNSQKGDDETTTDLQDVVFHHSRKEDQVKFSFVARLLLEDHYHNYPDYIINELARLNPKHRDTIEDLFKRKAVEKRLKLEAPRDLLEAVWNSEAPRDLLKAILYLFSTSYIYQQFNEKFAAQAYHELAFTLSTCVHELMERPDLKVDPTSMLYRGLRRQIHEKNYIVGETVYWPAFTSTSLDIKEAEKFAEDEGIVFKIKLSQASPYPHVLLKEGWSQFPKEKEVLLFPHFPMKVKSKERDGSRMVIYIEQDKDDGFLSLDRSELSKYWGEFIKESVRPNYETSFELVRIKILESFQLSEVAQIIKKRWDLDEVLEPQRFENRINLLKESLSKRLWPILDEYIESQSNVCQRECVILHIDFLSKEISSRLWESFDSSIFTELSFLLEGFVDRFFQLTQESSYKTAPAILIAKVLQDMSLDWSKLDEKMKIWMNEKLDEIKPQLIQWTEKYWREKEEKKDW